MVDDKLVRQPGKLDVQDYGVELEPGILEILQTSFGDKWGDCDQWRWKYSGRPGFIPSDVVVFSESRRPVACFHMMVRPVRLFSEVDVTCTVEGDYAIRPEARGSGLLRRMYLHSAPRLIDRAVVLRAGFTSQEAHDRVYQEKFGHRMIPTVTAHYKKILSDRGLRTKVLEISEALRVFPWWQRFLERNPLTIRLSVAGFQPCTVVLTRDSSSCTGELDQPADLAVAVPYGVLAAGRLKLIPATFAIVRSILSGQVRVAGLPRLLSRVWL